MHQSLIKKVASKLNSDRVIHLGINFLSSPTYRSFAPLSWENSDEENKLLCPRVSSDDNSVNSDP